LIANPERYVFTNMRIRREFKFGRMFDGGADLREERNDGEQLDAEICLFVRDEQTRRFLLDAKALQALGTNPAEALQGGYPTKEQSALAEAAKNLTAVSFKHRSVALVTDFS
jgi:hypothetical protein